MVGTKVSADDCGAGLYGMKNHYIPKFYLKRWAVGGDLVEFQKRNPTSPEVTPKRRTPAATGYKVGLYDFYGLPLEKRHFIEKVFFQKLDSKAADALVLLEARSDAWTVEIRRAWCLFLISLIQRHPEDILAFRAVYTRDFLKASRNDREVYEKARGADDPSTVEEYFRQFHEDFVGNMALNNIPRLIMHERAVQSLMNMNWFVAVPPEHGFFLTSDRPTVRTFLGQNKSHWIVPIGPKLLFVAAASRDYGKRIQQVIRKQGWKEVNRQLVRQAVALGYADDQRHLAFFQKHLSKATRPSFFLSFVSEPENAPPLTQVP